MKKFKLFLLALFILPCCFLFSGCALFEVYVTDIYKTGEDGTYTIYYSNGKKSTITIEDGKDGENATLDLESLFNSFVSRGLYENTEEGFRAFVKDYFDIEENTTNIQKSINKSLQSAVAVYAAYPTNTAKTQFSISAGAGVIYSMENTGSNSDYSYIVTNYHVVYAHDSALASNISNDIVVYQYGLVEDINVGNIVTTGIYDSYSFGSNAVSCEYIGGAINYDIAVLKVKTKDLIDRNTTARAVDIADKYSVGETAIAIGNPNAEGTSVTKGIVSVDSEYLTLNDINNQEQTFRIMRIDTAINGGNSGGGLFNANGELIGIVNAKSFYTSNGNPLEGMGYALPLDNITKVAENIIRYHNTNGGIAKVKRLQLGVTLSDPTSKQIYNEETGEIVLIDEFTMDVVDNGFAKDCGVKVGDAITAIKVTTSTETKEYKVTRFFNLRDILLCAQVGDQVSIQIKNSNGSKWLEAKEVTNSHLVIVD